jgi:LmbE family N-acetylglucosaminyl deacetylase
MEIRDPAMPDPTTPGPRPEREPVDSVSYRVDGRFTAVKVGGFVIFALAALAFHDDHPQLAFAAVAAVVLAGYALRDIVAPVRLAADREGVTVVHGYAGRRRLAWDEIERVRLDQRRRLGTRAVALEIDTGDHIYLLTSYDLGADPADAVAALHSLSPSADPSATG